MNILDNKDIRYLINDLVDRGYKDSSDLPCEDSQKLCSILLNFGYEIEAPDTMDKIQIALRTNENIDKIILADQILNLVVKALSPHIDKIFSQVLHNIDMDRLIENGCGISMDKETGEINWGK